MVLQLFVVKVYSSSYDGYGCRDAIETNIVATADVDEAWYYEQSYFEDSTFCEGYTRMVETA